MAPALRGQICNDSPHIRSALRRLLEREQELVAPSRLTGEGITVVSLHDDPAHSRRAVEAGADGYLGKGPDGLAQAVRDPYERGRRRSSCTSTCRRATLVTRDAYVGDVWPR